MGIRRKLKSLLHFKLRGHHDQKAFSPPRSPIHNAGAFYQHPNEPIDPEPIRPVRSHVRRRTIDIQEPLEFTYKSYTTASGLVIPPDFSYDRPKKIYEVSRSLPNFKFGANMRSLGDENNDVGEEMDSEVDEEKNTEVYDYMSSEVFHGDDEASILEDHAIPTASDYSSNTLSRMTELALTAHQTSSDNYSLRLVSPRPLPSIPATGSNVESPERRGVRILSGRAMRKARGLRIISGGNRRSRIVRIIGGGEVSSGDEQPRPAPG
jgi:hypothetical protein